MSKPTRLKYTGTVVELKDDDGNVIGRKASAWFDGVPTRDLDEADIADLDVDTLKKITGGPNPLYVDPDDGKKAKAAPRNRSRKSTKRATQASPKLESQSEPAVEEDAGGDQPNDDEEPASEPTGNA